MLNEDEDMISWTTKLNNAYYVSLLRYEKDQINKEYASDWLLHMFSIFHQLV